MAETTTIDAAPLAFDRTVPRALVHRSAVSEVFVTDAAALGDRAACVAVQLPSSHAHYGDHTGAGADPLLLMEAARQAGMYGGHLLGIPPTLVQLISASTLHITRPDLLSPGARPVEVLIDSTFDVRNLHGRRPRDGSVRQRMSVAGTEVATNCLEILMMTRTQHDAVRAMVRDGPIPTTVAMADRSRPDAVAPAAVGRVHPANVVLARHRVDDDGHAALVAPRFGNRGLFDHTYDHLPGAVLTEAARQLTLLALDAPGTPVVGLAARFPRFAELDAPVIARTPVAPSGTTAVPVTFSQGDGVVATVTVTVVPARTGGIP